MLPGNNTVTRVSMRWDDFDGTGSPSPEPSRAQRDLWTQAVAGYISEVFVFGGDRSRMSTLGLYLPQTLCLEPIACDAYRYGIDGVARSDAELVRIARQLAAGKRWIAEGTPSFWARPFMDRAQAIIWFDTVSSRLSRFRDATWPDDAIAILGRIAEADFPDKVLRVTSRSQIRQLRAVRATHASG